MLLGEKLKETRQNKGLSQSTVAEYLNISRQSISKWEGAQSVPAMDKILQMSDIFGVTTDFLLKDSMEHEEYTENLGNKIVCHSLPIRPGRNLAVIVESAAVNHRQKKMGYNAAEELYKRVQANIARKRES